MDKEFLESMPIALILTDVEGEILKMNKFAIRVLKACGKTSITSINEIDLKFNEKDLSDTNQFQWINSEDGSKMEIGFT